MDAKTNTKVRSGETERIEAFNSICRGGKAVETVKHSAFQFLDAAILPEQQARGDRLGEKGSGTGGPSR